jgi:predicted amidophosphoribosyltransferase
VAFPDLLGVLLPRRCVVCRLPGDDVCDACRRRLDVLRAPLCARCGAPTAWPVERCGECSGRRLAFASARSAVAYDAAVRAFVRGWKEHGLRGLAAVAAEVVVQTLERPNVEQVAFVAADPDRGLSRGYHPAEALARALAADWELPVTTALARTRPTPRQAGLAMAARRRNVAGVFSVNGTVRRRLALFDDFYTTCATTAAAASALRAAGARRVDVVTFARAIR